MLASSVALALSLAVFAPRPAGAQMVPDVTATSTSVTFLPGISQVMAASTLGAVSSRINQVSQGAVASGATARTNNLSKFFRKLEVGERAHRTGTGSWMQALAGSSFALPLSADGGHGSSAGGVTLWGAGDYRGLSGGDATSIEWDGGLFGGHLGVDARIGSRALAGLALSVAQGKFDYTHGLGAAAVRGDYESRMTSIHPYMGWSLRRGNNAWAVLGFGEGSIRIRDGSAPRQSSDSRLRSAGMGGNIRLHSAGGPETGSRSTFDLKAEAWLTQIDVDGNETGIEPLRVDTRQFRLAAEKAWTFFNLASGASFGTALEIGARVDGGDGENGAGADLSGRLGYANPGRGVSADLRSRVLLAHRGEQKEWSVGGSFRVAPGSGRGMSLRVTPSYGETRSGPTRMWDRTTVDVLTEVADPVARLDVETGYGLGAFSGLLTPYSGFELSEGGWRSYRLGTRFHLGSTFELTIEGEHRERKGGDSNGISVHGRMRF